MLGVWKMDIAFLSANEIASRIRSKEFSCREILEHYLERIDRFNPELNAIVVDLREEGLETADRLDELVQRGEFLGPLHGVPMTVKESYNVAGTPTTFGKPGILNFTKSCDCTVAHFVRQIF